MWMQMRGLAGSVEWKERRKRVWHQDSWSSIDLEGVRHPYWFLVESFVVDQNPKSKSIWYFPSQADQGYGGLAVILLCLPRQVNLKAEGYSPPPPAPSRSRVAPGLARLEGSLAQEMEHRATRAPASAFPRPPWLWTVPVLAAFNPPAAISTSNLEKIPLISIVVYICFFTLNCRVPFNVLELHQVFTLCWERQTHTGNIYCKW